jgi:hypothetical protein
MIRQFFLKRKLWADVSRLVAVQGAGLGRDSEVVWALWLLKEIGIKVTKIIIDTIIDNNSPLVLGLLAHMHANGFTNDKEVPSKLIATVDGDASAGYHWPLSLELNYLELAKPPVHAAGSPLGLLHADRCTLIDWDALPAVFVPDEGGEEVVEGEDDDYEPPFAIEDYASDYESDEEEGDEDEDEEDGLDTDVTRLLLGDNGSL